MKTKPVTHLNREARLSLSSPVHCGRYDVNMGACHPLCEKRQRKQRSHQSPPRIDDRSRTKALQASLQCTAWTQNLESHDRLEYRHGAVRALGTPTMFWMARESDAAPESVIYNGQDAPLSPYPGSFF